MRYDEKLAGYQALLAELESGLEFFDPQFGTTKLASTKIRGTAPKWVYVEAHQKNSVFYFPQDGGPYVTLLLKYDRGGDDHKLGYEIARQEVVEWVKARISEGPPKPKLKWEVGIDKLWWEADVDLGSMYGYARAGRYPESHPESPNFFWRLSIQGVWIGQDMIVAIPDGGYPAPFLEAEEALHNLLSAALDALNNPKP